VDGLNLRSDVVGLVLIVVVVLVAVFNGSDLSDFEDEAIVIAALSEINSVEDHCDVSHGSNNDAFVTMDFGTYLPHDDDSIKTVLFDCRLPWEDEKTVMLIHLRYPLKTGIYAQQINMQTRLDVVGLLSEFFEVNLMRGSSAKEIPYEELPLDSHHRSGEIYVHGYVPFASDNYFGVKYETEILDVEANTSQSLLLSRNYELYEYDLIRNDVDLNVVGGRDFPLSDVVEATAESYKSIRSFFDEILQNPSAESSFWTELRDGHAISYFRETHFSLTPDALELGCEEYCYSGLLAGERWGGFHSIPYTEIEEHLINGGPLRFVR
jgi:hypothetical protein